MKRDESAQQVQRASSGVFHADYPED